MENSTRNLLLFIGIALIIIGILLWYFESSILFTTLFAIAGIILVVIAIYNWGSGTDFLHHQETPIENEDIEFKREY